MKRRTTRRANGPRDLALLGKRLESLRREWRSRRLDSDPLVFAHRFQDPADREVVAFLSASLAFGRVASIQASVARVLAVLGPQPSEFLAAWDEKNLAALRTFRHRWVSGKDLEDFLRMVKRARHAHGSLGALFAAGDEERDFLEGEEGRGDAAGADRADYVAALSHFHRNLFFLLSPRGGAPSRGLRFLLPAPAAGSACKRSHLFLRWMIRTEGFDLGLWTGGRFTPARLLLPMDVHVHRISRRIGLTRRRTADLAASREATGWLRLLNPDDPVAYDWPLSRLGILSEPMTLPTRIASPA
ncbi:MAG: TIGR02757 family protein [Thermoanaerobaculia bacterium]|nr:TIGR02757 family protein [Thermoanaerobaculia bacterium]